MPGGIFRTEKGRKTGNEENPGTVWGLFAGIHRFPAIRLQRAAPHGPGALPPHPVGITQAGDWFLYTGKWEAIPAGTWQERHCLPAAVSPNRRDHGLLVWRRDGMEIIPLDGAFPVLHGKNGEDGTVQGLLELAGIPVVGCGTLASALCMDKMRAHQLVQAAGIEIPRSLGF